MPILSGVCEKPHKTIALPDELQIVVEFYDDDAVGFQLQEQWPNMGWHDITPQILFNKDERTTASEALHALAEIIGR